MPSQWRMSGINAWNLMSFTPAIFSVRLKYSDARSKPRFRALYTRYYNIVLENPGYYKESAGDQRVWTGMYGVGNVGLSEWGRHKIGLARVPGKIMGVGQVYEWLHVHRSILWVVYLCNFTKSAAFFSEVNDHPTSTFLCLFDSFFDTKYEIRTARADVRSEYITSVTLIMDSKS